MLKWNHCGAVTAGHGCCDDNFEEGEERTNDKKITGSPADAVHDTDADAGHGLRRERRQYRK